LFNKQIEYYSSGEYNEKQLNLSVKQEDEALEAAKRRREDGG